jgi:hypothetical protein
MANLIIARLRVVRRDYSLSAWNLCVTVSTAVNQL